MLKLKAIQDGAGFYYGFHDMAAGGNERIDLMPPAMSSEFSHPTLWSAYVAGERIGRYISRPEAEAAVLDYCNQH